ncbi:carotenoid biosynthesis protein [Nonomuraea sp. NPDC048916]|uniref:carotenoid biosynthesis protein n=1 Tax=Nonomuraea sp. NPDC048916 TaxID=3154232 RepID=UPI0034102A81
MHTTRTAPVTGSVLGPALGSAFLCAMVAAQVMSGLSDDPPLFTEVVVALLAASAVSFAAAALGRTRAVAAFGAAVAVGYAAELVGVHTGFPFGAYHYTDALWPQAGGVPLVVALAWGGMGLAAYGIGGAVGGRGGVVVGALALTAWDLFLDPQMIRLGLWVWADPGPYRGVPLTNLAGWLLVSLLVMVVIRRIAGHDRPAGTGLVALYTTMAAMETLGFAAVFDPPDPLVAAVGGVAMGTFAVVGWRRLWLR